MGYEIVYKEVVMHSCEIVIRPRYEETDQMGVIYHGNYFTWFEVGRSELFRTLGYTYRDLEAEGIILPVLECNCKFIKPAKYDVEVIIKAEVEELKGIRIKLKYTVMRKSDREVLAQGFTWHGFVNKDLKPVKIQRVNPTVWNLLRGGMDE